MNTPPLPGDQAAGSPSSRKREADSTLGAEESDAKRVKSTDTRVAADEGSGSTSGLELAEPTSSVGPEAAGEDAAQPDEQPDPEPTFPFLSLPAEIRLKVYGHLFIDSQPICPPLKTPGAEELTYPPGFHQGVVGAMTRANRQLAGEVTHFLYSNNTFQLSATHHRAWIAQIGRANAGALRRVQVMCDGRPKTAGPNLIAMLATLRKRAADSLVSLAVIHNISGTMNMTIVPRVLVIFGGGGPDGQAAGPVAVTGWRPFRRLEQITVVVPQMRIPHNDEPLYRRLCAQTGARVKAMHRGRGPLAYPSYWPARTWLELEP